MERICGLIGVPASRVKTKSLLGQLPIFRRHTYMPAVLVELGFIDSADVWLLKEHQEDMARAVARGGTDYGQESLAFSGAKS
ncbi:MAG: hypothetical protein E7203_08005 [Selenomonas ruminantium]|uniref:N-acetylmuramoyl-L-alanine amidase n=1 Tax=Selenomonas ruminantium TaxID=971 RepID=A0A927ZP99_SELRU|nr:N-acetylmuramoyl-L-alanine amidase [Selenomonas ruminantium]MBE6085377.1 hypothetical protein [Selenomonas ruminantium]